VCAGTRSVSSLNPIAWGLNRGGVRPCPPVSENLSLPGVNSPQQKQSLLEKLLYTPLQDGRGKYNSINITTKNKTMF